MWDGPVTDAPAVADLVRNRLTGLDIAERGVVDVVALAEPIGPRVARVVVRRARCRIVRGEGHPRDAAIRSPARSPPRTPALRRRRARRDECEHARGSSRRVSQTRCSPTGASRVGDRLRVRRSWSWRLRPPTSMLLVRASIEARALADFELAERLGRCGGRATIQARVATVDLAADPALAGDTARSSLCSPRASLDDASGGRCRSRRDDRGAVVVLRAGRPRRGGTMDRTRASSRADATWAALLRGQALADAHERRSGAGGDRGRRGGARRSLMLTPIAQTRRVLGRAPGARRRRSASASSASTCRIAQGARRRLPAWLQRQSPTARSSGCSSAGSSRAAFPRSIRCSSRATRRPSGAWTTRSADLGVPARSVEPLPRAGSGSRFRRSRGGRRTPPARPRRDARLVPRIAWHRRAERPATQGERGQPSRSSTRCIPR